jgi:membrane-bound inhibitor of C-type lysozyme
MKLMDGRIIPDRAEDRRPAMTREVCYALYSSETGERAMKPAAIVLAGAAILAATGVLPAAAQTFKTYGCADGTQFIVAFYQYDKRAHLQIDGKAVALNRRIALSGARYSRGGIVLKVGRAGATIKHGKRPASACSVQG